MCNIDSFKLDMILNNPQRTLSSKPFNYYTSSYVADIIDIIIRSKNNISSLYTNCTNLSAI